MFTRGALLYIGQRLVLIVFTAVAVSSIVFLGVHPLPGSALLNERRPDPAAQRELLHFYHLALPLSQQYVRFVEGVLHGDLGESLVNRSEHITLRLPYASIGARLTRASILEVIRQDYVRTARAKGLTNRIVIIRHALRNALIPVVTILGPLVIGIITGSVVIENIFGIPGLGKEFATSILQRDYNIVIGLFTFYAIIIALANLIVDLLYTVIDPRIRY